MERDFLGLSSKEPFAAVKEEFDNDGGQDSGYTKSSGVPWSSKEGSALPHVMPFTVSPEDKTKKLASDPLLPISDAFVPNPKRITAEIQKTFNHDRQGGNHFSLASYPMQPDLYSFQRPHEAKLFSVPNQAVSVSMGNPSFKNPFALPGQMAGSILTQPIGGVPVTSAPNSFFQPFGSIVGITEPWNSMKSTGSPAQLTIFYGGSVSVYEDVTPEKAQAIMFLAGARSSVPSNITHPKTQVHGLSAKMATSDAAPMNQPANALPSSALSSPLSVSSHSGAQSGSGSTCTDELRGAKTKGVPITPISMGEPPRIVGAVGPVPATAMMPSAVPQARKASLARFLEKRKERVMSAAAPYNLSKKYGECAATESNGANFTSSPANGNGPNVLS